MEHKISNELPPLPGQSSGEGTFVENQTIAHAGAEVRANQAFEAGQGRPQSEQQTQATPSVTVQSQGSAVPPITQLPLPSAAMPAMADDTDLIEKEWVIKAKEIVARTKDDPYQQNKEVERIKADYMKKRYNRDIKVVED